MKFDTAADIIKSAPRFWRKLKSKNRQKSISSSSSSSSCFLLRGRHRKDRAPSPKSVNSRTRVRAKYSRGLPVAWTKVARFTAEGGRGTLKRENKRRERTERQIQVVRCSDSFHAQTNMRGLPLWNFSKDTEHASLPSRICAKCYYIFSCIYNITLNLLIIPYFLSSRNFIYNFKFEKNTEEKLRFPGNRDGRSFPFFPIKGWNDGVDGSTRYSAALQQRDAYLQKSRRRAATQAAVKRINTQWDSFVPRLLGSRGLVSLLSLFKARSIPTDIGLPGVREFSFHLSSPPHEFYTFWKTEREKNLFSFFSPH